MEEDAGFVFQRKKPVASVPEPAKISQPSVATKDNIVDAKNNMAAIRRRKSSIGGLRGAASSRRQSSFGIALSQSTTPYNNL